MDPTEVRRQKLEAGKEKLAAFRKKKTKRKVLEDIKTKDVCAERDDDEPSPTDVPSLSEELCAQDNDQLSVPSGDEWSGEDPDQGSSAVYYQKKLVTANQRFSEFEETVEGKQLALDAAIQKSGALKQQTVSAVQSALAERDEFLTQLTRSLQSLTRMDVLPDNEVIGQVQALAEHVCALQSQLQQADRTLQEQSIFCESSALALQDAKAQMLQLQTIIMFKDKELDRMAQASQTNVQNSEEILPLTEQYETRLNQLKSELQARMEECEAWSRSQQEWTANEQDLLASLNAKSVELSALQLSQQAHSSEMYELKQTCEMLQAQLCDKESLVSDQQQLTCLRFQLEELREAHEKDTSEIAMLKKRNLELEEKTIDHSKCLSSSDLQHIEYETLLSNHSQCLSQLENLKSLNHDLQQNMFSLRAVEQQYAVLRVEYETLYSNFQRECEKSSQADEMFAELNRKYSAEKEFFMNEINELHAKLTRPEASSQLSSDLVGGGSAVMTQLQDQLQRQDNDLQAREYGLAEVKTSLVTLQSSHERLEGVTKANEDMIAHFPHKLQATETAPQEQKLSEEDRRQAEMQELEQRIHNLELKIERKEIECKQYRDQIVFLQDQLLTAQDVHGMQTAEKSCHAERMEKQVEDLEGDKTEIESEVQTVNADKESLVQIVESLPTEIQYSKEALQNEPVEHHIMNSGDFDTNSDEQDLANVVENVISLQSSGHMKKQTLPFTKEEDIVQETDALYEKIQDMTVELKSLQSMNIQYQSRIQELENSLKYMNEELANTKASALQSTEAELVKIQEETSRQVEAQMKKLMAHKDKEETQPLQGSNSDMVQQLTAAEKDTVQEEMRAQLESTISQWQRLQVIVQEKEVEIQRLQEDLEEQRRICYSLKRAHEEEKELFHSEIDSVQRQNLETIKRLENEVCELKGNLENLNMALLETKKQVNRKDSEIDSLHDILTEKEQQVSVMKNCISVKEVENVELQDKLESVKQEFASLENSVSENQAQPQSKQKGALGDVVAEDQLEIEGLRRESELESLPSRLVGKKSELEDMRNILFDREVDVESLKDSVMNKDVEIQDLKRSLEDKEFALENLWSCFAAKELEMESLRSSTLDDYLDLESLQSSIAHKESEIEHLKSSVTEKETESESLRKSLAERESAVEDLQSSLAAKELEIGNMRRDIHDNISAIEDLKSSLAHKEVEIENLKSSMAEKETENENLRRNLAKNESAIELEWENMRGDAHVSELEDLQSSYARKEVEIRSLKSKLADKEEEIQSLKTYGNSTSKLEDVQDSFVARESELEILMSNSRDRLVLNCLKSSLSSKESEVDVLKDSLISKESEIDDLKKSLTGKESQNLVLQNTVTVKESEMETVRKSLTIKELEIEGLRNSLVNKESAIEDMRSLLARLESEVDDLRNQIAERDSEIDGLRRRFTDRNSEMDILKSSVEKAKLDEDALKKSFADLESDNVDLKCHLANRESELQDLRNNFVIKESEMNSLKSKLLDKESEIEVVRSSLTDMKSELEGLKSALADRNLSMEAMKDSFSLQASEIHVLKNSLVDQVSEIESLRNSSVEKDCKLKALRRSLTDRAMILNGLKSNLSDKESELDDLRQRLIDKESELDVLRSNLTQKESEVRGLKNCLTEMESENDELKNSVTERRSEVLDLKNSQVGIESKLDVFENNLERKESEIKTLKSSLMDQQLEIDGFKTQLEIKESEVSRLKLSLRQRESEVSCLQSEISELKNTVTDAQSEVDNLKHYLQKTTTTQEYFDTTLIEKDAVICRLESEVAGKEAELATVIRNHTEKEVEVNDLKDSITEIEVKLHNCEKELAERESFIDELNGSLKERELEIDTCRADSVEKELGIVVVTNTIAEKESENYGLLSTIALKESEAEVLRGKFKETVSQIEALQRMLTERDHELADLKNITVEKTFDIEVLTNRMEEMLSQNDSLQTTLCDRDQELALITQERNIQQTQLSQLQQQVVTMKEELDNIRAGNACISQMVEKKELLHKLEDMQKINYNLQSWLSVLTNEVQEKEEALFHQQLQIEEQAGRIKELTGAVEQNSDPFHEKTKDNIYVQHEKETASPLVETIQQKGSVDQQEGETEHISNDVQTGSCERVISEQLSCQLRDKGTNYDSLLSLSSFLQEELQHKEAAFLDQKLCIDDQSHRINDLSEVINQKNIAFKQINDMNTGLKEENSRLTSEYLALQEDKKCLEQQISRLQGDLESQELAANQYLVQGKQLSEKLVHMTQTIEAREATIFDLKHDCDMYMKEVSDLKHELEQKDIASIALKQELETSVESEEKSKEEKEMLKSNFDSCMEDMQQRLTDQAMEMKRLRAQLAEEAKSVHLGQDQMKEIFEQQISQMEERLLHYEKQCEKLQKELDETKAKSSSAKEVYEHQLSELELNIHSTNSELVKMKDHLSKVMNNHECEIAGLKRLHEIQTNELEETCLSLERTIAEQRRHINEQNMKFNKERSDLEQTFEIQLSDAEEKKRFSEMEISRLKKHFEEMKQDHERDIHNIEKSYELRICELEDKCCIAAGELERLRKSLLCTDEGFTYEREVMEKRVEELDDVRRCLELRSSALEDEVVVLRDQAVQREEEIKLALQNAAEKHDEKTAEMSQEMMQLQQQLSRFTSENAESISELRKQYEAEILDLHARNKYLEMKVHSLEMNMEEDLELKGDESNNAPDDKMLSSEVMKLQSQCASLSSENNSLKRQLSEYKSSERSLRKSVSSQTICIPDGHQSLTSEVLPSEDDGINDCFSPEEELPLVEGFVAEHSMKLKSATKDVHLVPLNVYTSSSQEPDFVEEQRDGFKPEIVHERVFDSTGQLNTHPIREVEIQEGFQPETPDLFLMETIEEPDSAIVWPCELSVGRSPSHMQEHQEQFDYNIPSQPESSGNTAVQNNQSDENVPPRFPSNYKVSDIDQAAESLSFANYEKQLNNMKESLEEEYVTKMRQLEVELTHDFETKREEYKREMEQHFEQRVKAVKYEWERKFTKALQKVKKEMEKRHVKELRQIRQSFHPRFSQHQCQDATTSYHVESSRNEEQDPMPDIVEKSEELGEVVEQLHKENQELAEVRDVLLRQIEISQARGLHSKVQHELQSMLLTRDTVTPNSSTTTTPTLIGGSPTMESEEFLAAGGDEIESSKSEMSETSSARERFLEELEEISHQSSQDLPLEWELTSTTIESGNFEQEPDHRSVWEVFDGRCVRQDCQELDTLRIQYEHQVSSLQRQLEAERRSNQEQMEQRHQEYTKLASELRTKLDSEQQQKLDQVISELTQVQTAEIQRLNASHQHDISLELTALKLSMEQIYISKTQLEISELQMRYEQQIKTLNMQHKEELSKQAAENSTCTHDASFNFSATLTEQYNQLIQRISRELEVTFHVDRTVELKQEADQHVNGKGERQVPMDPSQDICSLLISQQEEITSLRSKLLTEYESLLQSRMEAMLVQTSEVVDLEEQMSELHKQYEEQLSPTQENLQKRDDAQRQESQEHKEHQAELKSCYERRAQEMEEAFEKEINTVREKYENQITSHFQARLNGGNNETLREAGQDGEVLSPLSLQHGEYINKTKPESAESDMDSSVPAVMSSRLRELEAELVDRDVKVKELSAKLETEESRSSLLDKDISDMRQQLEEIQQQANEALSQCSHLQRFLEEKDSKIRQLEIEKGESEKLYRDLLEKELPRPSKETHLSGSSVDDSFTSARDDVQDTPRSAFSDIADYKSPRSDLCSDEIRNDNATDLSESIPFANVSSEFAEGNVNNNFSSSWLEGTVNSLKQKVEELHQELAETRNKENELRNLIQEKEHSHSEMMETLRHELEHEKKMEVDILQSEFRIQMEIELKRQAAEISQKQSLPANQASGHETNQQHHPEGSTAKAKAQIDSDMPSSVSSDILPSQESFRKPALASPESSPVPEHIDADTNREFQNTLMQISGSDDFAAERAASFAEESAVVVENLSDDSKVSTSVVSSPIHGTRSPSTSTHILSLTDIEKEMAVLQEEYETKLTKLKEDLELAVEESRTMTFNHQQEMEELRTQLYEAEGRYDRLLEGIQNGNQTELNQLMTDKYDGELELAKSLMQKDFDEELKAEKKKFAEKHRKLMGDFMEDRGREEEELKGKHKEELTELRQTLTSDFEEKLRDYEQEIERLSQDLDLLRDINQEEKEEDENLKDRTLPEIDEITLSFQNQDLDMQPASPDLQNSHETLTPVRQPIFYDASAQYEDSQDEAKVQTLPTIQQRTFGNVMNASLPLSAKERQEMEQKLQQLVSQVEQLTQQLSEGQEQDPMSLKRSPQHSPHNDTLKGDGSALVAMLQSDLDRLSAERESVQRTNDHLLSLLSDSVKTYVGVEDTINRKLSQVVTPQPPLGQQHQADVAVAHGSLPDSEEPGSRRDTLGGIGSPASDRYDRKRATPDGDTSQDSQALVNTSILSNATDEGLEISQRLAESIFVGPDLDAEGEEILTDARGRLQTAVGQLLELMERSTIQLMEAKATQQELLNTLAGRAREVDAANIKCSELESQLASEIEAKEYLGLELHKAEGLISGYSVERESLENQIQALEEQHEALIVELDTTRSRLEDFQRSQSEIDSMREEVGHQQQLLRENAGQEMQALLDEVTSLNQEKRELISQLQYQLDQSCKHSAEQEAAIEESERHHEAALEEKNHALEDLRLQLENVERQLKASKAFVDEQMAEREQEQEEHQKEIDRLQQILDGRDRTVSTQQRLQREIADLTEQLHSRIVSQGALHQRTLELQKALEDKELNTHDLKKWVSQLESELDQRGDVEEQLKHRISRLEKQLTDKADENAKQENMEEATSVCEREEKNSPPMSPARSIHRPSLIPLEEELQRVRQVEEELQHENSALKDQVQQQLLQISGLKNQLDQLRHYGDVEADSDAAQLRQKLQVERDNVERMEEKMNEAESKIENLESILKSREEEAEVIKDKVSRIQEITYAQEENENLKSQLEELQSQISDTPNVSSQQALPPELLVEKNCEIEELKAKLQLVEEQLTVKVEGETLQQDKIRDLQKRLKERDEEISDLQDNITSLRRGEPCLDVSLPLNEEAGNMLNISMTGRTSIQQELEDTMAEQEAELTSLRGELELAKKDLKDKISKLNDLQNRVEVFNNKKEDQEKKTASVLEESVYQKDNKIYELTMYNEELRHQIEEKEAELNEIMEERDKSQEQLHEKEDRLDQMVSQIDSLQQEISSLTTFQNELQKDFDTVQSMLDEKEREIESLTKELTDSKSQPETLETVLQLEKLVASLQKDLVEKQNVVEEKEEELYELHDRLEEMGSVKEELNATRTNLAEISEQLKREWKLRQDLEDLLAKEKELGQEMRNQKEINDYSKEEWISTLENSCKQKDNHITDLEEKIDSVEQQFQILKERAESETLLLKDTLGRTQEEYEQKLHDMQTQLKEKEANYLAMQIDSEWTKTITEENKNLKLQIEEKDLLVQRLQEHAISDREAIDKLMSQLSSEDKKLENFSNLEQQLKETEEQLRLRQSALLDMQTDKEQLLLSMGEVGELRQQLEEKDQNVAELEGQLRFRQSCILDMEAEKERILEERDDMNAELRQKLQDKEQVVKELQRKYDELKQGIGEEIIHMEQEMQRSSQARLLKTLQERENEQKEGRQKEEEIERKLHQASDELLDMAIKQQQTEERLAQTSQQLAEREEQIQQLQAEIQNLPGESAYSQMNSSEMKIKELETQLRQAEERADTEAIRAVESQELVNKLDKEIAEMRKRHSLESEVRSPRSISLSASFPLQGRSDEEQSGLSRWESEPTGLAMTNRDSVYLRFRMTEVERLSRQQQKELSEKNQELDRVRQDLERWLKMGKGEDALRNIIKEKETTILNLQSELQTKKIQLEERDWTISSLQNQLQSVQSSSHEVIMLKDLKSDNRTSISEGESLSPETKQSISHLKMQLKKAHAALEEMQHMPDAGKADASDVSSNIRADLEKELGDARQMLREQDEELSDILAKHDQEMEAKIIELKSQHDYDLRQLRQLQEHKLEQSLAEQRQALDKQYETEICQLKLQHQRELHTGKQNRLDMKGKDHSTEDEESLSCSVSGGDAMPERMQGLLESLNQLGEDLLSVSDMRYLQQYLRSGGTKSPYPETVTWSEERHALMDTIDALKDLIQQTETATTLNDGERGDWRGELLQALVTVYEKERRVLKAEVSTANSVYPELDIMTQLESRLHDLEQVHQRGLDEMFQADRQSMIDEIDSLHHRLLRAQNDLQDARDQLSQHIAKLEEAKSSAEWKLRRQVQMLEYKLQQEGVVQEDLKKSLRLERQRVSELSSQFSQERSHTLELQSELASTKIHLSKMKDALEREQHRFKSVTDALEEERAKSGRLTELLGSAKHNLQSLQEEVADAKAKHQKRSDSEEGYIKDLETELKKERQRSCHFSEAEEKAKEEIMQLSDEIGLLKKKLSVLREEYDEKLHALHQQHMEKEMQQQLEVESEAVSKLTELLDAERESHQNAIQHEKSVVKQLSQDINLLVSENSQLRHHYETEKLRADNLKSDLEHIRMELAEQLKREDAAEKQAEKAASHKQLKMVQRDREELKLKVNELEEKLGRVQARTRELERELTETTYASVRLMSDDSQQTKSRGDFHREALNTLIKASVVDQELKQRLAQCCSKLQAVAVQLQGMETVRKHHRGHTHQDHMDGEEHSALATVVSELRQLKKQIQEKEKAQNSEVKLPHNLSDSATEEGIVYDRTIWASERLSLQMALDGAEHEIQRLRSEIQNFRGLVKSEGLLARADPNKVNRLYGKFLRAESFRKALIYQKKYLLLLLGGYRDTEQETLAFLASMGGFSSHHPTQNASMIHTRAFTMFRSAGRVVIAIFRMKYLVKKWKRAARVGSPVMTGQITHEQGYIPSSSSFPSHQLQFQQHPFRQQQQESTSSITHSGSSVDCIRSLSNGAVSTVTSSLSSGVAVQFTYSTPPTKDLAKQHKSAPKGNREEARRCILQDEEMATTRHSASARSQLSDNDDSFLHYLESVQQQLSEREYDDAPLSSHQVAWR